MLVTGWIKIKGHACKLCYDDDDDNDKSTDTAHIIANVEKTKIGRTRKHRAGSMRNNDPGAYQAGSVQVCNDDTGECSPGRVCAGV